MSDAVSSWNSRADLPPTLAQALELPEIAAMVAALRPFARAAETWLPEEPRDETYRARIEHPEHGMEPHGEFTFGDLFRAMHAVAKVHP